MKFLAFTLLVFASTFQDSSSAQEISRGKTVVQSSNKIGRLFFKTKIVCVGRYLLEVPEKSTVVYGPASTPYHIERHKDKGAQFAQMVEDHVQEALSKRSKHPIGPASRPGSMVGTVLQGYSERQKLIYGVDAATGAFYSIQSLFVVGNDVYVQEHSHYGDPAELGKIAEELKVIAASIVPRESDGAPARAGICIDGALVLAEELPHHERTTVGVRLADDVHFSMEMTLKDRLIESDALEVQLHTAEERAKVEGRGKSYAQFKFLRRGERQILEWKGYEALVRRPQQAGFESTHEFAFVSQGEPNNPMLPVISLDLYTGILDNTAGLGIPSLSDNEAVEIWDHLINSIRPLSATFK